jgi:hypothetical protein
MEFSGRLAAFPPSDILQWVFNDRRTGALVVRRSDRTKRIYFRRGDVVACFSDDPAEYYGQLLLIRGLISQDELMRALKTCQQRGLRLGVVLHELGLLSAEVIQRTLREQIEDSVCDVFLWKGGFFYFEEDAPPEEELLPEPISTLRLAMEGSRWVDELDRIRQIFVHDNIVLRPGKLWQAVELSAVQERICEQVDGRSNIDEIYRRVNGSYFRFLDACYGLAVHEVVDIASVGDEATGRSYETGVFNLLFQQAANESRNLAQRQPVLPFDVIENMVPLWLGPRPADESGDLWRRCDGSKPLKALLGGINRVRDYELDQIQLHIRQGRLALLPCPLKDLAAHQSGLVAALAAAAPDSKL